MKLSEKQLAGQFSYYRDGSQSNPVSYMFAQDISGDGVDEVFLAAFETQPNVPAQYSNTSVHIFGWTAQGVFQEITSQWLPSSSNEVEGVGDIAFGDFNGDGLTDVFLSAYTDMNHPVNAYVLYNTGNTLERVSLGQQTWMHSVRAADINSDGFDDVIPTGYSDMPRYLGSPDGLIKKAGFTGGSGLAIGDFLGNGTQSVIFVDAGSRLNDTFLYGFDFTNPAYVTVNLIKQLPGPRLESIEPTASSHDIRAIPMDFNDDGLLDVVVVSWAFGSEPTNPHRSEIQFLQNEGAGTFGDVTDSVRVGFDTSGYVGYVPQAVDVNQDGLLDLFFSMPDWLDRYNSTTLLIQTAEHTFVDTARDLLASTIESGGGQGLIVRGPANTNYLVSEGAWDRSGTTSVYIQSITFPERDLSENLTGTLQEDSIFGFGGNDVIDASAGSDYIDGGYGLDTVAYVGAGSNYQVMSSGMTYLIKDKTTEDLDTLVSVEKFEFSDLTVDLTIKDQVVVISQSQLTRVQELYVAFFNRVPDGEGLAYWAGEVAKGKSIDEIADSFYEAGIQYSDLTGFSSSMSHGDFVNVFYKNVLGRKDGADAEGLKYWSDRLVKGEATRGSLVSSILDSAHTFDGDATWGWVASLLDNKAAVANTFSVEYGITYKDSSEAIAKGMQIASLVGATDTAAAIAAIGLLG